MIEFLSEGAHGLIGDKATDELTDVAAASAPCVANKDIERARVWLRTTHAAAFMPSAFIAAPTFGRAPMRSMKSRARLHRTSSSAVTTRFSGSAASYCR
jgi:hypothetical protein